MDNLVSFLQLMSDFGDIVVTLIQHMRDIPRSARPANVNKRTESSCELPFLKIMCLQSACLSNHLGGKMRATLLVGREQV